MGLIELKQLLKFENWKFSVLLLWLMAGIGFMEFFPLVGIIIFLPFLAFVMFLLLLSLVSKKNVQEYAAWKIILLLILSIPLMLLISVILIVVFGISMFSYIFLTSWFALYGCYLTGKNVTKKLENKKHASFLKGLTFSSGTGGSFAALIGLFFISGHLPQLLDNVTQNNLLFLNYVYIVVAILIVILLSLAFYYLSKKTFIGWSGIFFFLIVVYTFYFAIKVILGMGGSSESSISSLPSEIVLLIGDLFILMYAISTIIGSQVDLLTKKLRRFREDTILMWLIFSKASYEFAVNFPYELIPNFSSLPFIESVVWIGSNLSTIKNIGALIIFIFLILVLGIYELRKHHLIKQKKRPEALEEPLIFLRNFKDRFKRIEGSDYNLVQILHENANNSPQKSVPEPFNHDSHDFTSEN